MNYSVQTQVQQQKPKWCYGTQLNQFSIMIYLDEASDVHR
jgi:hypothetical protein